MNNRRKKGPTLTNQLLEAIEDSGLSINQIALGAGIPQPVLHRFVADGCDIRLVTIERLAAFFNMRLTKPKR